MKKIFKTVALITVFSLLTRILGFVLRIILSRTIGAEGLGIYQIAFSVFMVLETCISSGLPFIMSKSTAQYNAQKKEKEKFSTITAGLIIGFFTAILLCTVIIVFRNILAQIFTDKRCLNILITLLPALVFSSVYSVLRGYLWGEKRYFWVSITEFFEQCVRVIIFVLLTTLGFSLFDTIISAALSLVFACLLSCIFVIIVFFKKGGKLSSPKNYLKPVFKTSTPITFVRILSSLLMPTIGIIIPITLTTAGYTIEQALTQYGIAMGMTFPLLYLPSTLIGSLAMTLIPDISSDIAIGKTDNAVKRISSSIKFSIFVTFLVIPVFIGIGPHIGIFLYNNITAGDYLVKAAWIMLPMCINNIASSSLNALGLEVKSFLNYIIGASFLFLSIIFLPKYIGILSLVCGMGLCMTTASFLNIKMLKKSLGKEIHIISYILKLALIAIPTTLIINWTNGVLLNIFPLFFSIAISACLGVFVFILICHTFNIVNISSVLFEKSNLKRYKKKQTKYN